MAYKFQLGTAKLGGAITSTGVVSGSALSASSPVAISEGGTGADTASDARANLGLGSAAVQNVGVGADDLLQVSGTSIADNDFLRVNVDKIEGLSDSEMRTALGLVIGTDVQAYDAQLADIAGLAVTDGNIIVGDGSNFVAESGATARTSLGLGTSDNVEFANVTVNGDLTVTGSLTYVNTTNLKVSDALVTFASGTSTFGTGRGFEIGEGTDAEGSFKTATTNFGQGNVNHFASSIALSASAFYGDLIYVPNGVTTDTWAIDSTHISGNLPVSASFFHGDGSNLTGISADNASSLRLAGANAVVSSDITASNDVLLVDTSAARIIEMPDITSADVGQVYIIKDIAGSGSINNIEIRDSAAGHDLDGALSITIESDYGAVNLLACSASNGFFYSIF